MAIKTIDEKFLMEERESLEQDYKKILYEKYNIVFKI